MKTDILFRATLDLKEEKKIASQYFDVKKNRVACQDSLVVGRYSVLPHYKELCDDLEALNSRLINSYQEHKYIADFDWYYDVIGYTPKTWFDQDFYRAPEGKYVVKGKTNSRKWEWNRLMFANNKTEAVNIAADLSTDSMIGSQGIIYREYVPLVTYETGLHGLPFSNEWRFFFYKKALLSCGYYWSTALKTDYQIDPDAKKFAFEIADIISEKTTFFVLDIAEELGNGWTLIEINDGQCSGLSENDPHTLYNSLQKVLGC